MSAFLKNGNRPRKRRLPQGIERASDEQKAVLKRWLRDNLSYSEIVRLAKAELDLKTSQTAVRDFFNRHSWEILGTKGTAENELPAELQMIDLKIRIQLSPEVRVLVLSAAFPRRKESAR